MCLCNICKGRISMETKNYYDILSVSVKASDDEITAAKNTLAKKYHPDTNPGNAEAEAKFKEASEAYAVLSDSEKRRQYDQFGHAAFENGGGAGGFDFSGMDMGDIFGDIFGDFFGGGRRRDPNAPTRGANLRAQVRITLEEACFGVDKELELNLKDECNTCHGTGAKPGTTPETCATCGGKGQVVTTQKSLFGMVQNVTTCPHCHGSGKVIKDKCGECHGTGYTSSRKKIQVSIPAGIDHGQSVRIRGKGEPGTNGGARGDLLVEVFVERNPDFERRDYDIFSTVKISYPKAVLGGEIVVKTIDGEVAYTVKAGTQNGTRVRLRGKGVPSLRNKKLRGNHYVDIVVDVPTTVNKEQKKLLQQLEDSFNEKEGKKHKRR